MTRSGLAEALVEFYYYLVDKNICQTTSKQILVTEKNKSLRMKLPAGLNSDILGDDQVINLSPGMTPTTIED